MDHFIFEGGGVGQFCLVFFFSPLGCAIIFLAPYSCARFFFIGFQSSCLSIKSITKNEHFMRYAYTLLSLQAGTSCIY